MMNHGLESNLIWCKLNRCIFTQCSVYNEFSNMAELPEFMAEVVLYEITERS